jgi:putative oxidoreductase
MSSSDAFGKLIFRLSLGGLMLFHGVAKVTSPGSLQWIGTNLSSFGLPPELAYGVYAGEILAPVLIILGLFTRVGGLLMAINMIVAVLLVHMGELTAITSSGGWQLELQALYLFGGLALFFMGGGRYAVRPN